MTGGGKGDGSGINTILRTRLSQGYAAANIIMRSGRGGRDTSLSVCVCVHAMMDDRGHHDDADCF